MRVPPFSRRVFRFVLLLLLLLIQAGSEHAVVAAAQTSTTAEVVAEVVEEEPTAPPVPTDPPSPTTLPTDPPPPTAIPTDPPPPTVIPTETSEATEPFEPPTPTYDPTTTPEVTEAPTTTPTVTVVATQTPSPTPTETPHPVVAYGLNPSVECQALTSAASGILSTSCLASATLTATDAPGSTLTYYHTVTAGEAEGWSVRLRNNLTGWTAPPLSASWTDAVDASGTSSVEQLLPFSVDVTPSCAATATTLDLTITLTVEVDGIPVASTRSSITQALPLTPPAWPEPGLAFVGSLNFGEVTPSANGVDAQADGTIVLEATGLDTACGAWDISLSGSALVSQTGDSIPGGNLQLIAINDIPLASGPCAVTSGCSIARVETGPTAPASITLTLDFVLTVPAGTLVGTFEAGISADIGPA